MLTVPLPSSINQIGDGVLNINKERGWTSHDVVARLRKTLGGIKVGHAGTLDPAATGVLPVLIGRGTRIAEYLLHWDKEYRAVLRLGETTDTLDATGTLLERHSLDRVTEEMIREAVSAFRGRIQQTPPMYSAVKVRGVPLYRTARQGRIIDRDPREVLIHRLEIERIAGSDVSLRVLCSKGTYIRTLCADIGARLGVGGHCLALERSKVGPLSVEQAVAVEEFERQLQAGEVIASLLPLDAALAELRACRVGCEAARNVLHGVPVPCDMVVSWDGLPPGHGLREEPVRIKDVQDRLLAIGVLRRASSREDTRPEQIAIKKVLMSQETPAFVS
ncbi:MAG TPA: tRNA pseudouridine(55) synthase TruB [Nitrospiraceae bacterium]|nr:tRNA pseudouridine(55) synthase TruB [Nitrospiraceae bacterium]